MKHTNNYHLPQWSEDDLILMEDFNEMNRNIEAGLTGNRDEARQTAEEIRKTAQDARQTALQTAENAYTPGNKPYAVGSFTGNGADMTINLGFRPSFVIINGIRDSYDALTDDYNKCCGFTAGNTIRNRVQFTDSGFILRAKDTGYGYYPDFTQSGRRFDYIAFR